MNLGQEIVQSQIRREKLARSRPDQSQAIPRSRASDLDDSDCEDSNNNEENAQEENNGLNSDTSEGETPSHEDELFQNQGIFRPPSYSDLTSLPRARH